jgi:hypothetical protein
VLEKSIDQYTVNNNHAFSNVHFDLKNLTFVHHITKTTDLRAIAIGSVESPPDLVTDFLPLSR